MRAERAIVVLIAGVLGTSFACTSFESDATEAPTADAATAEATTTVDAATADAGICDSGSCVSGCPGGVVYVSPAGSDGNIGCVQTAPKATVGGAIAYIKTLALVDHEVHVCRGTYREAKLRLDYPVSLRGGYECASWTRRAPFGWNGLEPMTGRAVAFDATNESILDPAGGPIVLDISGASVTRAVTVDGFTIVGRPTNGGRVRNLRPK